MLRQAAFLASMLCLGFSRVDGADISYKELLYLLDVQTWRIPVPASNEYVWAFEIIPKEKLKPAAKKPSNLSRKADRLLAMRGLGENKYAFVLPSPSGGASRGILDFCEEGLACEYYQYWWLDRPACAADGSQCVIAEFAVGVGSNTPTHFLAIVQTRSQLRP